jgi:arylsulfatase A-like enzyme
MVAERETPVYKYIHLFSTHGPKVVSKECKYAGGVYPHIRETYTFMAKCTLDSLASLLDKMKYLGIYDDALILIHSDHGGWVWNIRQPSGDPTLGYKAPSDNTEKRLPVTVRAAASPLLAIKVPKAKGQIVISNKLASLLDIPQTISDVMSWGEQFDHISLLKLAENEKRKRYFRYYDRTHISQETDFVGPIAEYSIEGSHYESEWKLEEVILPNRSR